MNPELEKFIDFAVTDGEVTEKEKTILIRKAEELGVDLDEMEMVLDAKLHMIQKEAQPKEAPQQETPAPAPSQESLSTTKCPQCAAAIESFSTRCPYCDTEIKNIKSSFSINRLNEELMKAEEKARNQEHAGGFVGNFMKMFDSETEMEARIFNAKSNIIRTFPIPNTKEDILEFLTLAVSNVKTIKINFVEKIAGESGTVGYKITYKNAWMSVCQKVIMKARFSMKDNKKLLEEIEAYATELEIK